jgi:hypothetical protein
MCLELLCSLLFVPNPDCGMKPVSPFKSVFVQVATENYSCYQTYHQELDSGDETYGKLRSKSA